MRSAWSLFVSKNQVKKTRKRPTQSANRKRKQEPETDAYSEILGALDQLIDSAEDDISRAALDPVAALRAKCATLTVALRMCLLALSCHGQKKDFARQIAQNLDQIVKLKEVWDDIESQETNGQKVVQEIIGEESGRRFKLVEEIEDDSDDEIESDERPEYDEDTGENRSRNH